MSQTAIPLQFEKYLQNQISVGKAPDMNEMIFAYIPNLDPSQPIDRNQGLPAVSTWVHQQDVDQVGKLGDNALVYSVVIPGSVAAFTFNAIYLRDKNVPNSCGMVVHKATETKEAGMASTKSLMQQYTGAAQIAGITVDAQTWQIDYQARLLGIEEDMRLASLDNYGHTAFIQGFDVTQQADPTKYKVAPGVVYVGGLRAELKSEVIQTISAKPTGLYIDVVRTGTVLSKWQNIVTVRASATPLTDYVDQNQQQHYVARLAGINANGSVEDWREKGGLPEHEAAENPHPQYLKVEDMIFHQNFNDAHPQYIKLIHLVGLIAPFHTSLSLPGWHDLKGGTLSRITDKLLFDYAQTSGLWISQATKDSDPIKYAMYFGDGDGSSTFTLPNHHLGHFTRGNPDGVAHGETQSDAIRNIYGSLTGFGGVNGMAEPMDPQGAFARFNSGSNSVLSGSSGSNNNYGFSFDASKIVPTADENRPMTANLSMKIFRGWIE